MSVSFRSSPKRLACAFGVAAAMLMAGCSGGNGVAGPSSEPLSTTGDVGETSAPGSTTPGGATEAPESERIIIQNLSNSASDWPAYIAMKKGFFAEHNIDVAFITLANAPAATTALLSGSYDVANVTLSNMGPLINDGQDFKLIVETWTMAQVLMAGKNAPATNLNDALPLPDGTPVGAVSQTGEGSLIWRFLQAGYGGDPEKVTIQVDASGSALVSGSLNYGILNPNSACVLEAQGAKPVLETGNPGDISQYPEAVRALFGLHTNGYWATGDWVTQHPKAAEGLREVITESIDWMNENPDETASILRSSDFNMPSLSDQQFTQCVTDLIPTFSPAFPAENLTAWNTFLQAVGKTDKDLPDLSTFTFPGIAQK